MVLGGSTSCAFVLRKRVYGCVMFICLSGGFESRDILSKSIIVQLGSETSVRW